MGKQFSEQYRRHVNMANPTWRVIRAIAFMLSFGRDCVNPFLKAQQADHLRYKHLGREIPWVDVVPLHASTHRVVTALRAKGLTGPVNLILRLTYGAWIALWIYLALMLAQFFFHWHVIPSPIAIASALADVSRAV